VNGTSPVIGGLYGSRTSDGTYRIIKVLAVDDAAVHVRMYAERFVSLPVDVSSAQLSLGSLSSPGGFGIGHAPLSREGFLREARTLLATEQVRDEELDGYRVWAGEDNADS
jgi:hypothetical protein